MTIIELRKIIGNQLGLPSNFGGSPGAFASLSPAMQARFTTATAAYISSNPTLFNEVQVAVARRIQTAGGVPGPVDYSFLEKFSDFSEAYLAQVGNVATNTLNTVSNATGLRTAVVVAAVVAILWFGAPYVIPRLKAALAK